MFGPRDEMTRQFHVTFGLGDEMAGPIQVTFGLGSPNDGSFSAALGSKRGSLWQPETGTPVSETLGSARITGRWVSGTERRALETKQRVARTEVFGKLNHGGAEGTEKPRREMGMGRLRMPVRVAEVGFTANRSPPFLPIRLHPIHPIYPPSLSKRGRRCFG